MPGDEELQQNSAQEIDAPPPQPELPLEWAYLENGEVRDRGAAVCVVEEQRLTFKCKSGPPFDAPYSEIAAVEDKGVNLLLAMRDGSALELSKLARLRDMLRATLMEKWTKLNRRQALAEETLLERFRGFAARDGGAENAAGVGVYETSVVLDFESGLVARIPLVFSGGPEDGGYSFAFRLPGELWTVSRLGRETDRFRAAVAKAVNALEEKALNRVRALCPDLKPMKARALAGRFLDGLAVPVKAAREASPKLEQAMLEELAQAGLRESWDAVLALGEGERARVGQKKALRASEGAYRWFFIPVVKGGRAAVVMEASSEGSSGRATYVFRVPGGPDACEQAMDALNYGLVAVNFRREPIYMSDEQLRKPGNEHYLRSVERVPALAELRRNFIGRVAHTSPEAWRAGLEKLLS